MSIVSFTSGDQLMADFDIDDKVDDDDKYDEEDE